MSDKKEKIKGWSEFSRYGEAQSVGDVLGRVVSKGAIADKVLQYEVVKVYEKIVGKPIARMTDKLFVNKGKLYIKVESSALKQELVYARGKILEMLNNELTKGRIEELIVM